MLRRLVLSLALIWSGVSTSGQSASPERLSEWLRRYPEADANGDGRLTESEARAYREKLRRGTAPAAATDLAPAPTLANVAYGAHPRNVLDFWRASAAHPTPVVVFLHGGGFVQGDKERAREGSLLRECLEAGISFVAINYRFLGPETPLQEILRDCARAVQFVRSRAGEWQLDPLRLAAIGNSAGAGSSLWLAFHPDLADPSSPDRVARESSRPTCIGANSTQCTYDFPRWAELFGEEAVERFGGRYNSPAFYGLTTRAEVLGPTGERIRRACDMLGLMRAGAPPLFLHTSLPDAGPPRNSSEFLHHPRHAKTLYDRARELGVRVVAAIPAYGIAPASGEPQTLRDFLRRELGGAPQRSEK